MFCPFINGECRNDCAFHHVPRATNGGMSSSVCQCILAIVADQLDYYTSLKIDEAETQNS